MNNERKETIDIVITEEKDESFERFGSCVFAERAIETDTQDGIESFI